MKKIILHALTGLLIICASLGQIMPSITVQASETSEGHKIVRVGYFCDDVFHAGQSDDAIKSGYGYEYYQKISNYTSWEYEYVYGEWNEIYQAFLKGEIDIIDDISITNERLSLMDFSALPMGEEDYYIFVPEDSDITISDVHSLDGKRIGADRNSLNFNYLKQFVRENDLDIWIEPCEGYQDRINKMNYGIIDGMVTIDSFAEPGYKSIFRLGSQDFYFAVNKSRPDLLEELNDALFKIFDQYPAYNADLKDKYFKKTIVIGSYSEAEKQWLEDHPVIRVGYRISSMPYCDLDKETGEATGLLVDVLDEFKKYTGATFEPVVYNTLDSLIEAMNSGEVDCIFPVMDSYWLSEQNGYTQTLPVTEDRMSIIFSGNYKGIDGYKKMGYIEGSPVQKMFLTQTGLGQELIGYPTLDDCMNDIASGQIDGTVLSVSTWNYISNASYKYDKYNHLILDNNVGYCFAVPTENLDLYSILETSITKLDNSFVTESVNKHTSRGTDYSLISFIQHNVVTFMIIVFGIIGLLLLLIFRESINKATKDSLSYSSEHDGLSGALNRTAFTRITKELRGAGVSIGLGIVDIDDFKLVNDTYGHDMGDQIIRKVAMLLMGEFRSEDRIIRFGGDEFIFIATGLDYSNRSLIETKLNKVLENLSDPNDSLPPVTLSIGVAFSGKGYTETLFENADKALYIRKKGGKNGITFSDTRE